MVQELWVPEGVIQEETIQVGRVNPDVTRDMAFVYTFTFKYKGKVKRLQVLASDGVSRAEIEDEAAMAAEKWKLELDGVEHKPAPTVEQKQEIGKILNDINIAGRKRAASSTGKVHFGGIERV